MNRKIRDIILNVGMVVFTIVLLLFALFTLGVLSGCDVLNPTLNVTQPDSRIKLPTRMDGVISDYEAESSPIYQAAKAAEAEEAARLEAERIAAEALAAAEANQAVEYAAYQVAQPRTQYQTNLSEGDMIWVIAGGESGVFGRDSGNGYYGFTQISGSWLAGAGYPYGTGSGGVGDPLNPNPDMEYQATVDYCNLHWGSVAEAYYQYTVNGSY